MNNIAGVDEAGRGPWAGPVCVAAVVLPDGCEIVGLTDSKKLSAAQRTRLYHEIIASAVSVCVVSVPSWVIDQMNIRAATLAGMRRAVERLSVPVSKALIDGRDVPPGLGVPAEAIVGGDGCVASISAASIIAKVTRDRMMTWADTLYPHYGFAQHKGYGTAQHSAALEAHGPCPLHRMSFKPVRLAASGSGD